jgi:amino acid transporter
VIWVYHAFGPFWAFQQGFWSWLAGAIDNAIYPGITVSLLATHVPGIDEGVKGYFVKASVAIFYALPNFLGVKLVGRSMIILAVFVVVPFMVRPFALWHLDIYIHTYLYRTSKT